ncbi:potassium channel GORK-like isoform X2 [Spinacia oleracea]|uniref:Potassium channel n=1 Tax=Spinacia oleracea TaxID=3562 RepID=A0ABM3RJT3_SPIOL|nr:potassium channel GORK-like isoform X2 [Spinacia oleracea]
MAELIKGKILVSHALRNDFNITSTGNMTSESQIHPKERKHCHLELVKAHQRSRLTKTNAISLHYNLLPVFSFKYSSNNSSSRQVLIWETSSEIFVGMFMYISYGKPAAAGKSGMNKVIRVHEEFFLPGEIILEQGNVVDQLYFICHGLLEEVGIGQDGSEQTISLLEPNNTFGQISIFCNVPHPSIVGVLELFRLLRNDRESLSNIIDIYFYDGKKI